MKQQLLFYYAICICLIIGITLTVWAVSQAGREALAQPEDLDRICIEFLISLGYQPGERLEREDVVIPASFDAVYRQYNRIQKEAGYDLTGYRGRKVLRYTYLIKDHPNSRQTQVRANLLIYDQTIIGGDISSVALDGFMEPLLHRANDSHSP